jgi:hypothetical protein
MNNQEFDSKTMNNQIDSILELQSAIADLKRSVTNEQLREGVVAGMLTPAAVLVKVTKTPEQLELLRRITEYTGMSNCTPVVVTFGKE